jgi:ABC-2 type transport system permease protein
VPTVRNTSDAAPPRAAPAPLLLLLQVNARSSLRRIKSLREQSRLLTSVIFIFILGYLGLAFWLFYAGLQFIGRFIGLGTLLVERLLHLLFCFLFLLLLLSNLVISYSNLFRNRETLALLSWPVPTRTIFQWKFIESTLLASWAFLFLIAPLLAAFGLVRGVPWHFYVVTMGLVGLFIVLPGVAGSFSAVMLARHLDRRVFQVLTLALVVGLVTLAAWWFRPEKVPEGVSEPRVLAVLDQVLHRTLFAEHPLLPSYWVSAGVLQWADGAVTLAGYYTLVLLSYVLFFGTLAFTRMGNPFYEAASAVQSRGGIFARWQWFHVLRRRRETAADRPGLLERLAGRLGWLSPDVRALAVKDIRIFWRDTGQWAQSLVLFGLLGVYILNLRHFAQELGSPYWTHLVAYLNLGACSLNLATLTTRFVYPQFSLEGRRLWIVGMAPLGLARIVKAKYWLAASMSLGVTLGLILLSCHMLEMDWGRTLHFAMSVTIMTFTLTSLAVGLGVLYPNFKEENPSKIVSGFGGTFCLVLSFLYILASVILLAFATPWMKSHPLPFAQVLACLGGFVVLSALLGGVPLRLALQRLRTFEV